VEEEEYYGWEEEGVEEAKNEGQAEVKVTKKESGNN